MARRLRCFAGGAIAAMVAVLFGGTATAEKRLVIGHSQPNLGWPYIAAVTRLLEAEAKAKGIDVVTLSANGDIAKQSTDIATLVNRKVDVLLVTSLDGNAVVTALRAAKRAGIPILAVSNEPSEAGKAIIDGFSGPDDYEQGRIAAELLHEALGGPGGIGIIEGSAGQSTTLQRTKGFRDRLAELKSTIVVLASQTADWNPIRAKDVAQAFLTAHDRRLNGVFAQDDNSAAAAAEVFKSAGRADVKVVGTGGTKNGLAAIKSGLMYGTMAQSPGTDARQALDLALRLARREPLPVKRNVIPMPRITAANASDFVGEW